MASLFPGKACRGPAQLLSEILPLTHYLRIVRGIVLKGAEYADLHQEFMMLTAILCWFILVATVRFRKRLD